MATKNWQPKNWQELITVYNKAKQLITNLFAQTNKESQVILDYIQNTEDPSNIIEDCIEKCPQFVPHVRQVKKILDVMRTCYQCMNNNKWLQSQPEYTQDDDEDSSSSSSGGGFSIVQMFSEFENTLAVVNELNLNLNHVFDLTYTLQHSQDKYINKTAIRDLAKKMAKSAEKNLGKEQAKGKDRERAEDQMMNRTRTGRGM